jgi:type I restriction enzyme S subunit
VSKSNKEVLKNITILMIDGDWIESKDQSIHGIRLIQTGNIGSGEYLDKPQNAKYISDETFVRLKCTEVFEGDVLVSRLPTPVGRSCRLPRSNTRMITAVDCSIMRFDETKCLCDYFIYFSMSTSYLLQVEKHIVGSTRVRISRKNLETIVVPLPPIKTQKQIVSILVTAAELLSMRKRQLAEFDNLIKSIFCEMFGSPVANEKGWEIKNLIEVCNKITDGTHHSPVNSNNGDYKYITAKNIKKDGFDLNNLTYINAFAHKEIYGRCNPELGDILYIKDGVTTGIAQINTLDEEFSMLSSVALLKQNRSMINAYYLREVLNNDAMYENIRKNMGGAAITRLTIKKIEMIQIPLPPLFHQNQFADIVAKIEEQKALVKKTIGESQYLFDSLMSKYFD